MLFLLWYDRVMRECAADSSFVKQLLDSNECDVPVSLSVCKTHDQLALPIFAQDLL